MLENERRIRDQCDRQLNDMKEQHRRELDNSKAMHDITIASLTQSSNLQLKMLESTNSSLDKKITSLEKELVELRAKKEKTIFEQADELDKLKKLFKGDDDDGEEPKSKIIQGIEALGIGKVVEVAATTAAAVATARRASPWAGRESLHPDAAGGTALAQG